MNIVPSRSKASPIDFFIAMILNINPEVLKKGNLFRLNNLTTGAHKFIAVVLNISNSNIKYLILKHNEPIFNGRIHQEIYESWIKSQTRFTVEILSK